MPDTNADLIIVPSSSLPASVQNNNSNQFLSLYNEVLLLILSNLRSFELASAQRVCRRFNDQALIRMVVTYAAEHVYPPKLTEGYKLHQGQLDTDHHYTYEDMRNMELLVLARALSRPEPVRREGCFIVSKNWVRTALKWLEKCEQERAEQQSIASSSPSAKKNKKPTRKDRIRSRRLSDVSAPWPNVNVELTCRHGELALTCGARKANASRRLMDKHAFKVLRKLYPEGKEFSAEGTPECLQCRLHVETERKAEADRKAAAQEKRKLPLSHPLIRSFYVRNKGVPADRLIPKSDENGAITPVCIGSPVKLSCDAYVSFSSGKAMLDDRENGRCKVPQSVYVPPKEGVRCPLVPGVYHVIPRSWCVKWRKYIKSGGERPTAPDASELLCDAHKLPLIPPHLRSFLYGLSPVLLQASRKAIVSNNDDIVYDIDAEIAAQRFAMRDFGEDGTNMRPLPRISSSSDFNKEQLDKENHIVVEILTEDEFSVLEEYWPEIHSKFVLRFAVTDEIEVREGLISGYGYVEEEVLATRITWCTEPCSECYAGGNNGSCVALRNRNRDRFKKSI